MHRTNSFERYFVRGRLIRTLREIFTSEREFLQESSDFFYRGGKLLLHKKNFRRRGLSPLFCLILLIGCSVKNPAVDKALAPMLSDLMVTGSVYLRSDDQYPISVRVVDPQGWGDIRIVRYFIFPPGNNVSVGEGELKDDGSGGDIIYGDGIFFDSLSVDFAGGQAGEYRLGVVAEDWADHSSDTLFAEIIVFDDQQNHPPVLSNPVVPDTLTEETLGNVILSIRAVDPQGLGDIDTVTLQIYPPWSPVYTFQSFLRDDGSPGDVEAGDSIFSFQGDMRDHMKRRGDYSLRFQAIDKGGLRSYPVVVISYVFLANEPPVLSNLVAPTEVSRSSSPSVLLAVQVTDPQGLSDVKSVYFNTTKPDGTPSTGNPFSMFDNGTAGDADAGDGVYSLTIYITPQNDKGNYRFDFLAEDYSGAVSDTLRHIITVVD